MTTAMRIIALSTLSLPLVGCGGGEPSESDIEAALQKQIEQAIESSQGMFDKDDTALNSVKKIGCVEAEGSSGYMCDVDIDMTAPFVGSQKGVKALRFVETDDGWVAME